MNNEIQNPLNIEIEHEIKEDLANDEEINKIIDDPNNKINNQINKKINDEMNEDTPLTKEKLKDYFKRKLLNTGIILYNTTLGELSPINPYGEFKPMGIPVVDTLYAKYYHSILRKKGWNNNLFEQEKRYIPLKKYVPTKGGKRKPNRKSHKKKTRRHRRKSVRRNRRR